MPANCATSKPKSKHQKAVWRDFSIGLGFPIGKEIFIVLPMEKRMKKTTPLAMSLLTALLRASSTIRQNILLAPYTSLHIGGVADYFAEPETREELIKLAETAQKYGIPWYILGGGSNTVFHDKGFRGLIIRPAMKRMYATEKTIVVEAGAPLAHVIQEAAKRGMAGLEPLIGLPGCVGGAVRGNAGAGGTDSSAYISSVTVYDVRTKKILALSAKQCHFAYRHSIIKEKPWLIILDATFFLPESRAAAEQRLIMADILRRRNASQPKGKSAGCIFKNPQPLSAGKLIDESGLKGKKSGDMHISTLHGNFFQNKGNGTQKDLITLIKHAKKAVFAKKHIRLQEEVQLMGERDPLE